MYPLGRVGGRLACIVQIGVINGRLWFSSPSGAFRKWMQLLTDTWTVFLSWWDVLPQTRDGSFCKYVNCGIFSAWPCQRLRSASTMLVLFVPRAFHHLPGSIDEGRGTLPQYGWQDLGCMIVFMAIFDTSGGLAIGYGRFTAESRSRQGACRYAVTHRPFYVSVTHIHGLLPVRPHGVLPYGCVLTMFVHLNHAWIGPSCATWMDILWKTFWKCFGGDSGLVGGLPPTDYLFSVVFCGPIAGIYTRFGRQLFLLRFNNLHSEEPDFSTISSTTNSTTTPQTTP